LFHWKIFVSIQMKTCLVRLIFFIKWSKNESIYEIITSELLVTSGQEKRKEIMIHFLQFMPFWICCEDLFLCIDSSSNTSFNYLNFCFWNYTQSGQKWPNRIIIPSKIIVHYAIVSHALVNHIFFSAASAISTIFSILLWFIL
jgi:hypothetical protein